MYKDAIGDVYKQACADFERRADEIADRLIKRKEGFTSVARSMEWPVRMLQRWWRENAAKIGRKDGFG